MKASELKTGDEIQFFAVPYGSYDSLSAYRGASFEKVN